ncbi:hypothetical protein COCOBI_18-0260 [Coccomyxa sp. Obi]|nr:hypothetical protein COCOBI_18-0260 [Coccomyxa sp. Obi]
MPKVRCSTQDVEFKVSPWRAKKRCKVPDSTSHTFSEEFRTPDRQPEQDSAEVSAANIPANGVIHRIPACSSSVQLAAAHQSSTSSFSRDFTQQQPGPWNSRHSTNGGETMNAEGVNQAHWIEQPILESQIVEPASATAEPRQHCAGSNLSQQGQSATPAALPGSKGESGAGVEPLRADDSAAADRRRATPSISGTGYLIWLPDGRLSGHLISSGCSLGIRGREVLSERECTRDAEWKLLRLTLLNLTHKAEVSCMAEKTGEDSARLFAPFDLHGSEEGTIGSSGPPIDDSLQLEFACETILAESAAEQHLGRFSPSLRGRGAIVNVGPFTCGGLALAKLLAASDQEQLLYDEDLDG